MELFVKLRFEPKNFAKGKDLLHKLGMIIRRAFQPQTENNKEREYAIDYFLLFMVWS